MAISRDKKKEIVDAVQKIVSESGSVVFVNFNGLDVESANAMRRELGEKDVGYKVAKKTLVKRVLDDADVAGDRPELDGELALAYSDDILDAAREIYGQQKKLEEAVSITGGIFDGEYKAKDEMLEIARIPSADELRGKFVNVINSPIQGFVGVLNQIAQQKEAA